MNLPYFKESADLRLGHCQDETDLRREQATDRLADHCPAGELSAHLELFADAACLPSEWPDRHLIGCLSNGELDRLP